LCVPYQKAASRDRVLSHRALRLSRTSQLQRALSNSAFPAKEACPNYLMVQWGCATGEKGCGMKDKRGYDPFFGFPEKDCPAPKNCCLFGQTKIKLS